MEFTSNIECIVAFTEEERKILNRAVKVLKEAEHEIYESGEGTDMEDDVRYYLEYTAEGIQNIIDGRYPN